MAFKIGDLVTFNRSIKNFSNGPYASDVMKIVKLNDDGLCCAESIIDGYKYLYLKYSTIVEANDKEIANAIAEKIKK